MTKEMLMERFREGQRLARSRQYAQAEQAFLACLSMREADIPARNQLAMVYARTGREMEAEREFERCLALDANNLPALSQLGALYERQGKAAEAEEMYRKCIAIRPGDIPAALQLSRLLAGLDRLEEAEAALGGILPLCPTREHVPVLCQLGVVLAKAERGNEAAALFAQCLSLEPNNIPALHQLGMLCVKQGRPEQGEELFKACIRLDSRQYQAYHQLGMLYTKQGRYGEAENMLRTCISLERKKTSAYQHMGVLFAKQGRAAEADEMFRACLRLKPGPETAAQLAIFRAEQGDGDEAQRLLARLPKGREKSRARLMCAAALNKAGRAEQALLLLNTILQEEPGNVQARHQLGCLYLKKQAYGPARQCFEAALLAEPENPVALHSLAELYMEAGEPEKGMEYLERIAANEGEHYVAEKIGWITGEEYNPALVWQEITRHLQDDRARPRHGVFNMNALAVNQAIAQCLAAGRYAPKGMTRRYTIPWPGAGYAGGRDGDGHAYNAITVVTYWDGERIITAYPDDPVEEAKAKAI